MQPQEKEKSQGAKEQKQPQWAVGEPQYAQTREAAATVADYKGVAQVAMVVGTIGYAVSQGVLGVAVHAFKSAHMAVPHGVVFTLGLSANIALTAQFVGAAVFLKLARDFRLKVERVAESVGDKNGAETLMQTARDTLSDGFAQLVAARAVAKNFTGDADKETRKVAKKLFAQTLGRIENRASFDRGRFEKIDSDSLFGANPTLKEQKPRKRGRFGF
jgi:hypothetical protein